LIQRYGAEDNGEERQNKYRAAIGDRNYFGPTIYPAGVSPNVFDNESEYRAAAGQRNYSARQRGDGKALIRDFRFRLFAGNIFDFADLLRYSYKEGVIC